MSKYTITPEQATHYQRQRQDYLEAYAHAIHTLTGNTYTADEIQGHADAVADSIIHRLTLEPLNQLTLQTLVTVIDGRPFDIVWAHMSEQQQTEYQNQASTLAEHLQQRLAYSWIIPNIAATQASNNDYITLSRDQYEQLQALAKNAINKQQ